MSFFEGTNHQAKKEDEGKPMFDPTQPTQKAESIAAIAEKKAKMRFPDVASKLLRTDADFKHNAHQKLKREAFLAGYIAAYHDLSTKSS